MNRPAIAQFTRATAIRSAFPHPVEGWFGNSSCNIVRGPGTANRDFSPFKDFKTERFDVQFRTEFFSGLNDPQFGFPDTKRERPTFGAISAISPKEDAATKRLEELLHSHPELPDVQPEWILGAKAAVKEIEDRGASGAGDAPAQCLGRHNSATDGKRRH